MRHKYSAIGVKLNLFIIFNLLLFIYSFNSNAQSCTVNAGLDQTICVNEPLQLDGETGGTFTEGPIWKQVSGPSVIISDPTTDDPVITGYVGGNTYEFELSGTCGNGSESKQTVTVTVIGITIANAGSDIASCPNDDGSLVITANTPNTAVGETGVWSIPSGNPAGVIINDVNSPITVIELPQGSAGVTDVVWTITSASGDCESSDTVQVTNYGGVIDVDAGSDETLSECYTVNQSTTLSGTFGGVNLNGQQGTWSFVSGPSLPNINNPNSNNTGVSNLIEGTYVFRWDVVGPCASGSDTVSIIVPAATQDVTSASTIGVQRVCDASVTEATLIGSVPTFANETVLWEQVDGNAPVTIVNNNSSTTQVTNLVPPASGSKWYIFRYTIENNATNCKEEGYAYVNYNISNVNITANNGNDIILNCGEDVASIPYTSTGGNRTEYSITSGPSDSSLSFPTNYSWVSGASNGTATINNFDVPGIYTVNLRRRISGNTGLDCSEANSSIKVYVSSNPSGSNAGTDQVFTCGQVDGSLSGSGISAGETSFWSLLPGAHGKDNSVINDRYAQNTGLTGLTPGTYVFQYTVSSGVNCPPAISTTTIIVTPTTNLPLEAGTNQAICYNAPAQLAADPLLPSQVGTWSSPDGITFSDVNDPNAIATGFTTPSTNYTLTWTVDEATGYPDCGSAETDTVVITTTADESPTIADAGIDQCLASGTTTATLIANNAVPLQADEQGTWTQVSGGTTATFSPSANDPNATLGNLANGQYEFMWTVDNVPPSASCSSTSDSIILVIGDSNTSINAGSEQTVCIPAVTGSFQMNADDPATSGGVGTWKLISGDTGFVIDDINSPTATFSNLSNGTYVFEWDISYGSCPSSAPNSQVTINVGIQPTVANIVTTTTSVCNSTQTTITADPLLNPNVETGFWSVVSGPNTPNINDTSSNSINVTNLVTGQYTFRWTTVGGSPLCPDSTDEITFDVYKGLQPMAPINQCQTTSVFLEATDGTTGTWSLVSVNTIPANPTDIANHSPTQAPSNSNTANANVIPGNTYVYQYTTDYPGTCTNATEQVTVTISNGPSEAPNAGNDDDVCLVSGTSLPITAGNTSIPAGVQSTWSVLSQPSGASASFDSPNNNLTPNLNGLTVPGLYIIELNFSTGSCNDLSDVARIQVYETPNPVNAGVDNANACQWDYQTAATAPVSGIGT